MSSAAKHTPGPWRVERLADAPRGELSVISDNAHGGMYGTVVTVTDARGGHAADAALIAAAPELLAAAEAAANVLSLLAGDVNALGLRAENVPALLHAAIAKAKGGAR